jgi:hypothetical protein
MLGFIFKICTALSNKEAYFAGIVALSKPNSSSLNDQQPSELTRAPLEVPGHLSLLLITPSPSVSLF